jgi:hypothetical protein
MLKRIAKGWLCAVLFLLSTSAVSAAVVYDFALPPNGNIDAIQIQLTLPTHLTGSLRVFSVDDPEVTLFSTGSLSLPFSFIGVEVQPAATLVGLALADDAGVLAVLNRVFPDDFFVFNRMSDENGTFLSVAGRIEADLPYFLDTETPTAQLAVGQTIVPEPASLLSFGAGAVVLAALWRRKRMKV